MNWKNLITRSITGIVFVLVMICGTLWNILSNTLLYGLIILLCEREWEQMSSLLCEKYRNSVEDNGIERVCKFVFPIFSVLFFVLNVICKIGVDVKVIFLFPFLLFILMGLWLLFGNKNLSSFHILRVALSFFGILYITIPFTSSIELSYRGGEFSGFYLVILLCMIWISDTGA
ncbi:MAG TPA: hypothetical protein DDY68_04120, partial [Porphyromonadaceae bacterium]|nr:hypothetical protein [Porphyromonadaceae bacterium]